MSNNINVTVGADAVTVFDSPSAIELSVDIGETGAPGSQIYVVNVKDPNDPAQLTYIDGYPYVGSRKVNVGDILINYDTDEIIIEDIHSEYDYPDNLLTYRPSELTKSS